jgi:hypothetical protein
MLNYVEGDKGWIEIFLFFIFTLLGSLPFATSSCEESNRELLVWWFVGLVCASIGFSVFYFVQLKRWVQDFFEALEFRYVLKCWILWLV